MPSLTISPNGSHGTRRFGRTGSLLVCIVLAAGCNSLLDVEDPNTVLDPESLESHQGALTIYRGAVGQFAQAFMGSKPGVWWGHVGGTGMMTDELRAGNAGASHPDLHDMAEGTAAIVAGLRRGDLDDLYLDFQNARIRIEQGIGALRVNAPTAPGALTGRLYALSGFVSIMLGEDYCSGVPLSSAPFDGDITYGTPLTSEQLYEHAIVQFDSALAYAADSVRFVHLARVGTGRALLNLERFAEAAAAVASVPTTFVYAVDIGGTGQSGTSRQNWFATGNPRGTYTVGDREGQNGLDFVSANDPRVRTEQRGTTFSGLPHFYPLKYPSTSSPVTLADGIEARLIEAEAALRANDVNGWLAKLNQLRSGVALAPLVDPGSSAQRVDLLFRERAFWLFLTGHRLGDLRRLIRQYGRAENTVFPTGPYGITVQNVPPLVFGHDVNAPVPAAEQLNNPNFSACFNRDA